MPARDKYTVFNKHEKGYRKGIHKVPKFTRVRARRFFDLAVRADWVCFWSTDDAEDESQGFLTLFSRETLLFAV